MAHSIELFLSRLRGDDEQTTQRDPQGERAAVVQGVRQQARGRFTALAERVAKIRDDTSLSPDGKRQRIAELAQKTDLGFLTSARTETEENLAQLRTLLFAIPKSEREPILGFLHEQEVRLVYKDAPPHVRMEAFRKAMQDGQVEIARALVSGPLGSLVPAEYQQEVIKEHAQRTQAPVYENYQQAQILKEHLDSLHAHATSVLQALTEEAPARAVA